MDALDRLDKGESAQKIAKDLGVGNSTIKDWRKNRKDVQSFSVTVEAGVSLESRRTLIKPKLDVLDKALGIWFCPVIKEKALILIIKMGVSNEEYTASEGWLNRWKKRQGIHEMVISGERLSADHIAAENFINTFEMLINDNCFVPDQIYNIYETGLNYKVLPQKTLVSNQEKSVSKIEVAKERVTVAACSNASGTHKLFL
jgi:hypothetical protein